MLRLNLILISAIIVFLSFDWGSLPVHAQQRPQQESLSPSRLIAAEIKLNEARRLIADAMPRDRAVIEQKLAEVIQLNPYDTHAFAEQARYLLWQIAGGMRDLSEIYQASEFAVHIKELAPEKPLGDYVMCEILLSLGKEQEGENLCEKTRLKFPNDPDTWVFETRYFSERKPQLALKSAQHAIGAGRIIDEISSGISLALVKSSPKNKTGDTLASFAELYPDRWIWHRAALAFAADRKFEKSREAFRKAIDLGNLLESRLQLAIIDYMHLQRTDEALQEFEILAKQLSQGSTAVDPALTSGILAHKSFAWLKAGFPKKAAEIAQQSFRTDVTNTALISAIFNEFKRRKSAEELLNGLNYVAKENPFFEYAHIALGNLAFERKAYLPAVAHYSNAIALAPERDDLYSIRGHSNYKATQYNSALKDFSTAATLKPEQASYHYNKSCILALLGRKKEAVVALKEAIFLNKNLLKTAERDEDLAALRVDRSFQQELVGLKTLP